MKTKSGYFVLAGVDVRVEYTYKPAIPGRFYGPPENCFEDEPEEIEIYKVTYHDIVLFNNGDSILNEQAIIDIEQAIKTYEESY